MFGVLEKTHILFARMCGVTVVFDRLSMGILNQTRCGTKATIYISLSNIMEAEKLFMVLLRLLKSYKVTKIFRFFFSFVDLSQCI